MIVQWARVQTAVWLTPIIHSSTQVIITGEYRYTKGWWHWNKNWDRTSLTKMSNKHLGGQDQTPEVVNLQIMMIFLAGEGTEVGSTVSRRSCLSRVCLEMRAGWAAQDNVMLMMPRKFLQLNRISNLWKWGPLKISHLEAEMDATQESILMIPRVLHL